MPSSAPSASTSTPRSRAPGHQPSSGWARSRWRDRSRRCSGSAIRTETSCSWCSPAERGANGMADRGFTKPGLERLRAVMRGHVDDGTHPGLVWMVARPGHVHVDAVGVDTIGSDRPMRRDTIFRISSMTKPITAVATMILVEECRLRLDDPVDALLPELADRRVLKSLDRPLDDTIPTNRSISVRDLLTSCMGFGQMLAPPDAYLILQAASKLQIGMGPPQPSQTPAPDEWLVRLGTLPLIYQP